MHKLSLSQQYALRAALAACRHMLIRTGKHYTTQFVGGTRILGSTVQSLVMLGLLRRVEGSLSVVLSATGTDTAQQLTLEYASACATAAANTTRMQASAKAVEARRRARQTSPGAASAPASTLTMRLPYADN